MNSAVLKRVEQLVVFCMILGTIGMFQPVSIELYKYGFVLLGLSTLAFIVTSHLSAEAQ